MPTPGPPQGLAGITHVGRGARYRQSTAPVLKISLRVRARQATQAECHLWEFPTDHLLPISCMLEHLPTKPWLVLHLLLKSRLRKGLGSYGPLHRWQWWGKVEEEASRVRALVPGQCSGWHGGREAAEGGEEAQLVQMRDLRSHGCKEALL